MRRRTTQVAVETFQQTSTIIWSIKDFVAQTGEIALISSIVPLMIIICTRFSVEDIADVFIRDVDEGNMTIPYDNGQFLKYNLPPRGDISPWTIWWNWTVPVFIYFVYFARVYILLDGLNNKERLLGFIVTLSLAVTHGYIWHMECVYQSREGKRSDEISQNVRIPGFVLIAMAFPMIFSSCCLFTENDKGTSHGKAAVILFFMGIFESVVMFVLQKHIFVKFFKPGTSDLTRFLIRLGTPLIMKGIATEYCAFLVPVLTDNLQTEIHQVSVALFGPVGCTSDLIGRLMQSSGE